jgi:DNA replication protein
MPFAGFSAGKSHLTPIPAQFFSELLPEIDHIGELKVTLYAIWFLDRLEEAVRYVTYADFAGDERLAASLGAGGLADALERAVQRGSLLKVLASGAAAAEGIYFLNSPRGRAAVQAIERGEWAPPNQQHPEISLEAERPNIFRLYEQNVGPLTPLIAETLQDAEKSYPQTWVEEAFQVAVEKNVRKWSYIQAILKSWQEEGRDPTDRRNASQDRRKYVEGEFSDFVQH